MQVEYSKRSLQDKLGIKPGQKIYFHNPPQDLFGLLGELPQTTVVEKSLSSDYDIIHFFTKNMNGCL